MKSTKSKTGSDANQNTAKKKTASKPAKKPAAKKTRNETSELKVLRDEVASLKEANRQVSENFGKLLEEVTNFQIKKNAALGQILKGIYLLGIMPDEIHAKCAAMFKRSPDMNRRG